MNLATLVFAGVAVMQSQAVSPRPAPDPLARAAQLAAQGDRQAIATLRDAGQPGVDALAPLATTPQARAALDQVCRQFDCVQSKLYWHTDLPSAIAESRRSGKPILSLRLLGRLDEELSCANSRFFRTTLYSNPDVSEFLRSSFVLHWETVKPVPKVTIDFGDGRKIERTLIGNSIHYVLDSKGRPVDALPGLYGPQWYLRELTEMRELAVKAGPLSDAKRLALLKNEHAQAIRATEEQVASEMGTLGVRGDAADPGDALLQQLASLHEESVTPRATGKVFPTAERAGDLAPTKAMTEMRVLRQVDPLRRTLALDGVKNEFVLHQKIRRMFAGGEVGTDPKPLNERVYKDVFLMPLDDPWLGLQPPDVFTGM